MDEHPEYVDDMFRRTLQHPRVLERFLADTAATLHEPELAERTARHLVAHPRGLRRIMIETLDAARDRPRAQAAIVDAMESRADIAAQFLVDHPQQLATVSKAIVEEGLADPDTKGKMSEIVKELAK